MKAIGEKVYIIKGDPTPLYRPRFNPGQKRVYDSQKNLKFLMGVTLRSQHDDQPFYAGPLHLDVTFFMNIPQNSKRQSNYHTFKPDLDNLIKLLCDVLTDVLIDDDSIISKITSSKIYDNDPRTEFTLRALSC